MPRIYTRKGDNGTSSLYPRGRVHKSEDVFGILGSLDELGSRIGLVCTMITLAHKNILPNILPILRNIQNILIVFGSIVAEHQVTSPKVKFPLGIIENIELVIDQCEEKNGKLTQFLLTGFTPLDAHIQLCRTQTRYTERLLYKFITTTPPRYTNLMKYINRLSDFFFVLGRRVSGDRETRAGQPKSDITLTTHKNNPVVTH